MIPVAPTLFFSKNKKALTVEEVLAPVEDNLDMTK
jgi:hypothetical protein